MSGTERRDGATEVDLHAIDGKAELVDGRLVREPPTGHGPNRSAGRIFIRLMEHERRAGGGHAVGDNCAFLVDLPHRGAFRRGEPAGAEFAVPAWQLPVDERRESRA
jgi:hypothetical protein